MSNDRTARGNINNNPPCCKNVLFIDESIDQYILVVGLVSNYNN